ncbi:hypothetical protein MMC30_002612 [Trapelia coarctata]|nr:hypothetical protein [Trapelia coarctata]
MADRPKQDLVPHMVDHLAEFKPHQLYAEYPVSPLSYEKGYRKISYSDFANAVNGIAWWLFRILGPGKEHEVLAYIGPNDLRYPALILGAVKAGYTVFLTSPRNSVAAQISLLERLKCKIMLSPSPRPPPVTAILDAHKLRLLEVPTADDLLTEQYPVYPFGKTFVEARLDPLFIVHTSGSTGIPKPIVYTHDAAAANIKMMSLDPPPGFDSQDRMYQGRRVFLTFPPFHGAYLVTHLFNAVPFGTVMIAPTSGAIPSAEGLVEGLKKTPADIAFIVPSIVQELSQSPDLLDYCAKNLEMIIYCGGDLPQAIGDAIASRIRLVNQYGATELGLTAQIQSKSDLGRNDWKYVQFHPDTGLELRQAIDGAHELYVVRNPALKEQQPTFMLFPNLQSAYRSKDLFLRHPSKDKPDLWKWHARADDIIVFLTGEKTNPISMEQHITSGNPEIAAVLVVGAQRFQAALLIELLPDGSELSISKRAALIEKLWPIIEEANQDCPTHARIAKSHVLFTQPQKPMLRAGKGTVQRAGTLQLYKTELDALYIDADALSPQPNGEVFERLENIDDPHALYHYLERSILFVTKWTGLKETDNIFTLGMDSLQALLLVRRLRQGLAIPSIALSTVYANPTVRTLAAAVLRYSEKHKTSQTSDEQARHDLKSQILQQYQASIDRIPTPPKTPKKRQDHVVVLTGSTGALGSYILHALLAIPAVSHVYCLNRASDGLSLQIERNKARGLPLHLDVARVTFIKADLSQTRLGLDSETYSILLDVATLVIHNAWPVNFNLSLSAFRPQLSGIVNLIDFTVSAATSPLLFFISSISSVLSYHSASLQTPEEVVFTSSAPGPNGYAESKYLSERLLDYAARKLSINAAFARVGQVAGAANYVGLWNPTEWFPSLVLSSIHIGAIPDSLSSTLGQIDWVPVDLLAEILVELAFSQAQHSNANQSSHDATDSNTSYRPARVFHPLNPYPTTWEAVRVIVAREVFSLTGKPLDITPMEAWIRRVREDMESMANSANTMTEKDLEALLQVNPAVKLLDFYEQVLGTEKGPQNQLAIEQTTKTSVKLRAMEGITAEWMRKWLREWIAWTKQAVLAGSQTLI